MPFRLSTLLACTLLSAAYTHLAAAGETDTSTPKRTPMEEMNWQPEAAPRPHIPTLAEQRPAPKQAPKYIPFRMSELDDIIKNTLTIQVKPLGGKDVPQQTWNIQPLRIPVFYSKIRPDIEPTTYETQDTLGPAPTTSYKGLKLTVFNIYKQKYEPLTIFNGTIRNADGDPIQRDKGRHIEYWLWSTNPSTEERGASAKVLSIESFRRCAEVGNPIALSDPRQCLMPNGDLFLETIEKPTEASLKVKNFDQCLQKGKYIISTFPRRCVVAGGHVFTEEARLPQPEPTAKMVSPTQKVTLASPTSVTTPQMVVKEKTEWKDNFKKPAAPTLQNLRKAETSTPTTVSKTGVIRQGMSPATPPAQASTTKHTSSSILLPGMTTSPTATPTTSPTITR